MAVVNGRLTERSYQRFAWLGRLVRPMFRDLAWVGAQDQPIADRFVRLGAAPDRVEVTGSVKWDTTTVADTIEGAEALAATLRIAPNVPLWVCGSTGPGEESIILDAYARLLETGTAPQLVIVPRKPERFDEVAALIRSRGYACLRRSKHPDDEGRHPEAPNGDQPRPIILGDTMGELRKFYSLARVVFVGRSLVPMGGSDPMEAAALAKPIIVGPHTDNFAGPVAAFVAADAIRVVDSAEALGVTVTELIDQPQKGLGDRARQVVINNQGATDRNIRHLLAVLNPVQAATSDPKHESDAE